MGDRGAPSSGRSRESRWGWEARRQGRVLAPLPGLGYDTLQETSRRTISVETVTLIPPPEAADSARSLTWRGHPVLVGGLELADGEQHHLDGADEDAGQAAIEYHVEQKDLNCEGRREQKAVMRSHARNTVCSSRRADFRPGVLPPRVFRAPLITPNRE